ncbi:phosphatidylinositol 3-kinase 2-like [Condylostylus longicornis]|uniref:phosphatidylinositol 3-kinase 2-like n=1 Tax=Condylostylus longicornis TaxID=2530218 RepID=UPI00244DE5BE|nr:phosphatidylinositol 3-kinase 2-like [Condylostylus longicornis]
MDEAPKKGNPSLSIDRAAFLLLRVKKAFKRKRQQRKEKLAAQQAAAAAFNSQTTSSRSGPPPLLRSRTLPAIVVPGISILHAQIDSSRLSTGESTSSAYGPRLSLQPKSSRASLVSDDSSLEYRRKSSGSTHSGPPLLGYNNNNSNYGIDPYIYSSDEYERHADGTVVLRIPAPHVVAARAYRMSVGGTSSSGSGGSNTTGTNNNNFSSNTSATGGIFITPHQQQMTGNILSSTNTSNLTNTNSNNTALYRLARLLNQTNKGGRQSPTLNDDAPRRLSWERKDYGSKLPRSASIDSMVDTVWNDSPRPSLNVPRNSTTSTTSVPIFQMSSVTSAAAANNTTQNQNSNLGFHVPQQPSQLNINTYSSFGSFSVSGSFVSRRESLLSPSSNRRTKQNRGIAVTKIKLRTENCYRDVRN